MWDSMGLLKQKRKYIMNSFQNWAIKQLKEKGFKASIIGNWIKVEELYGQYHYIMSYQGVKDYMEAKNV